MKSKVNRARKIIAQYVNYFDVKQRSDLSSPFSEIFFLKQDGKLTIEGGQVYAGYGFFAPNKITLSKKDAKNLVKWLTEHV